MIPISFFAYRVNLDSRMLDKTLCIVGNSDMAYSYYNQFYPLLLDRYYDRLLPFIRQFLLIPNRNNKFMNLTANCPKPALINSAGI